MDRSDAGFSLVEMAVVLVIVGIVAAYTLNGTAAYMAAERQKTSQQKVAAASQALTQFVTLNKRLPCPADGKLTDSDPAAGVEALASPPDTTLCATAPTVRVLPWRTLGSDAGLGRDGWSHRLSYRTMDGTLGLTRPGGMDMSGTRAAATDSTAPSVWLQNKGLTITDIAETEILSPADPVRGGGAAFVVIAHGRDGAGAFSGNGQQFPLPPSQEASRLTDASATTSFVSLPVNDAKPGSPAFFDFILATPSVHSVATNAGIGPQ